ncbi:MAG: hypothetical protein K8L99_27595 [Anaerolineae bacterium]|nr:hypothetical protein [Anaerolineae bacterium]
MNVKLIMNWDIKPGRDQEYFEFKVREWIPGITELGLKPSGAWYTAYSRDKTPQILTEVVAKDLPTMQEILDTEDWYNLFERLLDYVDNYEQKIVRIKNGGFQL